MSDKNLGADKTFNKIKKNTRAGVGEKDRLKRPSCINRAKRGESAERRVVEALLFLMEKNDYDKITVTDITREAGISRMTYYRNYKSKDDILIKYFKDKWGGFLESAKPASPEEAKAFFTLLFTIFGENRSLISHIIRAERFDLLFDIFEGYNKLMITALSKNGRFGVGDKYETIYRVGGIFYIIKNWIDGGDAESPEEMAEIALRLLGEYRDSENDPS